MASKSTPTPGTLGEIIELARVLLHDRPPAEVVRTVERDKSGQIVQMVDRPRAGLWTREQAAAWILRADELIDKLPGSWPSPTEDAVIDQLVAMRNALCSIRGSDKSSDSDSP